MDNRVDYRMIGVTRIAVMVLDGLVLDTGGAQEDKGRAPYPEFGVSAVAGSNVFGMQEFVRVFHGTTDEEGFTAFHRPHSKKMATREEVLAAFGDQKAVDDYYPKILDEFNTASQTSVALKWTATGTATPATKLNSPFSNYWKQIEFANGKKLSR
jgi:hypothetical protein